jgi:hypothetical protein
LNTAYPHPTQPYAGSQTNPYKKRKTPMKTPNFRKSPRPIKITLALFILTFGIIIYTFTYTIEAFYEKIGELNKSNHKNINPTEKTPQWD